MEQLSESVQLRAGPLIANDPASMAPDNGAPSPYSIDIAPAAWRQLASFSQDEYRLVQERLRELAALATEGRLPVTPSEQGAAAEAAGTFIVGSFAARYVADEKSRTVRLMALENSLRPASNVVKAAKKQGLFE